MFGFYDITKKILKVCPSKDRVLKILHCTAEPLMESKFIGETHKSHCLPYVGQNHCL